MKKSIKKILALCAAAVMSAVCLCITVSAEELGTSASDVNAAAEEHTESIESVPLYVGTYSNGASYIVLRDDGTCYLHIVDVNGFLIRANDIYYADTTTRNFKTILSSYMVVDSKGNMQYIEEGPLTVDGTFNKNINKLTIDGITYTKE